MTIHLTTKITTTNQSNFQETSKTKNSTLAKIIYAGTQLNSRPSERKQYYNIQSKSSTRTGNSTQAKTVLQHTIKSSTRTNTQQRKSTRNTITKQKKTKNSSLAPRLKQT